MAEDYCDGCKRRALLSPLHGPEKGGPLRCYVCAGAWHAEHGRRRKMGRVVIRAILAFTDGGGSWDDVDKLKITAMGHGFFSGVDPLGYLAESATNADETILLTSEILADALRLVHPDAHPPERQGLASRVTQQLLALQPFVFPAAKPKPLDEASRVTPLWEGPKSSAGEPLRRYPCAECASAVPMNYCTACRAEYDRRHREELALINAKRKARRIKARQARQKPCAACGKEFRGKRKDARFCSGACRQRAHRTPEAALMSARSAPRSATRSEREVVARQSAVLLRVEEGPLPAEEAEALRALKRGGGPGRGKKIVGADNLFMATTKRLRLPRESVVEVQRLACMPWAEALNYRDLARKQPDRRTFAASLAYARRVCDGTTTLGDAYQKVRSEEGQDKADDRRFAEAKA